MPEGLVRADGRWARILAALEREPLSFGALISRVRNREHSHSQDRFKCKRAIRAMFDQGLVEGGYQRLVITDHGRMSFAHILSQEQTR